MNDVSSDLNNSRSSDFPMWYCPCLFCAYRSEYASNIGDHLKNVHNWSYEEVGRVIDRFFRLKEEGAIIICNKNPDDPTFPRKALSEGAGMNEGSGAERSVLKGVVVVVASSGLDSQQITSHSKNAKLEDFGEESTDWNEVKSECISYLELMGNYK